MHAIRHCIVLDDDSGSVRFYIGNLFFPGTKISTSTRVQILLNPQFFFARTVLNIRGKELGSFL